MILPITAFFEKLLWLKEKEEVKNNALKKLL
jgi:hypothetical protein